MAKLNTRIEPQSQQVVEAGFTVAGFTVAGFTVGTTATELCSYYLTPGQKERNDATLWLAYQVLVNLAG